MKKRRRGRNVRLAGRQKDNSIRDGADYKKYTSGLAYYFEMFGGSVDCSHMSANYLYDRLHSHRVHYDKESESWVNKWC